MDHHASQVQRFVRAVHRRLVLVRMAERMGWCALGGCAAGLALTPILLWRGQPALEAAAALLAGGVVAGVAWALARPPTRLQAAVEADRQLRLHDLIGTALAILEDARFGVPRDDPWMHSALAAAEARVSRLRPGEVVLARWGRRAWGGLGLAAALLLTLAMLSSNPGVTHATGAQDNAMLATGPADGGAAAPPQWAPVEDNRRIPPDARGQDNATTDVPQASPEQTSRAAQPLEQGHDADSTASGAGSKAALTQTPPADAALAPTPGATPAAGGAGAPTTAGAANAAGPAAGASKTIAPWQDTASWNQSAGQAMEALRSGSVPDEYRDLVGAYFQRQ